MASRQTLLTLDVQETICEAIRNGNWFETACRLASICPDTAREWLQRGEGKSKSRPANAQYIEFSHAVRMAEAQIENEKVLEFRKCDNPGEFLARRFPMRWGKAAIEITGPGGGPVQITEIVVEHEETR